MTILMIWIVVVPVVESVWRFAIIRISVGCLAVVVVVVVVMMIL